jgi:hypothetical protein
MRWGPWIFLWLVIKTAWRHSFHAAHSIILGLIILAGIITTWVPRVELLVDLHGWQVAAVVLGGIIAVRLFLTPYWIWRDNQREIERLRGLLETNELAATDRKAKDAIIDSLAAEISWAINNLVNPTPVPLATADPNAALDAWEKAYDSWTTKVSTILENRDLFTAGDKTHFEHLGFIQVVNMTQNVRFDRLLSQLNLRLDRLREVEHRARERR